MNFKKLLLGLAVLGGLAITSCSKTTPTPPVIPPVIPPVVPPVSGPADSVSTKFSGGILGNPTTAKTFTFLSGKTYNISTGNVIFVNATVTVQPGAKILFGGVPLKVNIGYNAGPKGHIGHDHNLNINLASIQANIARTIANNKFSKKPLLAISAHNHNLALAAPDTGSKSHVYSIYLTGGSSLMAMGTATSHVVFTTQETNPQWPNGYWGGINVDSTTKLLQLEWTDVSHTGGSDSIAGNQYAIYFGGKKSSTGQFIIENSSVEYGVDDCTRLEGAIKIAIRGNIFKRQGSNDGDGLNIKSGVTGDVCYNYVWSGANNSIKLFASTKDLTLITNVNVYNNTILEGGWRKVGEASSGILMDQNAKGTVFNNLIVNCRNGFTVTALSDTLYFTGVSTDPVARQASIDKHINNNFIYALVDSVAQHSYGFQQWGVKRSNDISSLTLAGQVNPKLLSFDGNTNGYTSPSNNALVDPNDPHLAAGSPAIGKGNTTAPYNTGLNYGAQWAPGADIGAYQYTTTTVGNQRL